MRSYSPYGPSAGKYFWIRGLVLAGKTEQIPMILTIFTFNDSSLPQSIEVSKQKESKALKEGTMENEW